MWIAQVWRKGVAALDLWTDRDGVSAVCGSPGGMTRWDSLFDDLGSQLDRELEAEQNDVLAEEERLRMSRLLLRDRIGALVAGGAGQVELVLRGGAALTLAAASLGRDWIAGETPGGTRRLRHGIVPLDAVTAVLPRGSQLALSRSAEGAGESTASGISRRAAAPESVP